MSDHEEIHYGIRYTSNTPNYQGSHISEYGPDRARALAEFHPDKLIQVELLQQTVTYSEWRPASAKVVKVNMYPASDVKSAETGATTVYLKPGGAA